MPSGLFVHNGATRFVRLDLDQLRLRYEIKECYLSSRWLNPFTLWKNVKDHDFVFGWFASWHTFLPMVFAKLLGKASVLVVGGYDVANLPKIGYGHQRGGLKKWVSRWTMKAATQVLAISRFSSDETQYNAAIAKEKLLTVYIGVPDSLEKLPQSPRSRLVLTVGNVDRPNLWRKGHEPFVKTAALMPDTAFVLVGAWKDDAIGYLRSIATANVTFTGRVDDRELLEYYCRASVYVQASLHEGFGLSVAEAMLAGCIPVLSRLGALPEVAGEHGVFVAQPNPENLAQAIETALNFPQVNRAQVRQHILSEFPIEERTRRLGQLIDSLLAPTVDSPNPA